MNVVTKFLEHYSYRFPKGYPDLSDPADKDLLRKILSEELNINLEEADSDDAEEAINILKQSLNLTDDNFKKESGKRYKILVPGSERVEYIKKIQDIDGFEYDSSVPGSSVGGLKYKNILFLLKPSSAQGRSSAGTGNEDILINKVQDYIDQGATKIVFKGKNKSYTIDNINNIEGVGYDVAGGKKADVIISASDKNYPISIKQDNAGFWESADSRYNKLISKLSDKILNDDFAPNLVFKPFLDKLGNKKEGIYNMFDDVNNKKVTGIIVTNLPENQEESIIFGSDNAIVIYKTYTDDDFKLSGNTLTVNVSKIIENIDDVEEFNLEPVLNIRHDSTRAATRGIRATVQPKNLVYPGGKLSGDKIELDYNEIV